MAIYNYNNGYNYQYGYNNGNYTSQTNIINVGNGCGGDNICTDGYSLYFPCLKNITRGQNVCFDFFVGDNDKQDEVDIRDLDALTLTLSGLFGCEYGTYEYPNDIKSLQIEKYREVYRNIFCDRKLCTLTLEYKDENFNDVEPDVTGKIGEFYSGDIVTLKANDTKNHIFVGWMTLDNINDECDSFSFEDLIVSKNKEYTFIIYDDMNLYALYRERKTYKVSIDLNNRHSYFEIEYDDYNYILTDKKRDIVYVKEGHYFVATCHPNIIDNYTYNFYKWSDGELMQSREFIVNNDDIKLYALCENKVDKDKSLNFINSVKKTKIEYNIQYPDDNVIPLYDKLPLYVNDEILYFDNACLFFVKNNGYLNINNGNVVLSGKDIDSGIKVSLSIKSNEDCSMTLKTGNEELVYNISKNIETFETIEYLFRKYDKSNIEIITTGDIYIDEIIIYEEIIENKGKMNLCLTGEETSKMNVGILYANGAISVNGNVYGISQTQIGNINKNKIISII